MSNEKKELARKIIILTTGIIITTARMQMSAGIAGFFTVSMSIYPFSLFLI